MAREPMRRARPQSGKSGNSFPSTLSGPDIVNGITKSAETALKVFEAHAAMEQEREKTRQLQEETKQEELKHRIEIARIEAERLNQTQINYRELMKVELDFLNENQKNLLAFVQQWKEIYAITPDENIRSRILTNIETLQNEIVNMGKGTQCPQVMNYLENTKRELDV